MVAFFSSCVNAVFGKISTHRSLLAAAAAFLLLFPLPCSLFPLSAFAEPQSFTWRGADISYDGATLTWSDLTHAGEDESEPILIFTNGAPTEAGAFFSSTAGGAFRVLAIGGGGAGGTVRQASPATHSGGGGGGAGEFLDRSNVAFGGTKAYSIIVGAGGKPQGSTTSAKPGLNGGDSYITVDEADLLRVKGGGGGGGESVGSEGGSGGGGSYKSSTVKQGGAASPLTEDGKGNKGGDATTRYAGGGGGAGEEGGTPTGSVGGKGGDGLESDIDPNNIRKYAAGGGGGTTDSGTPGDGGAGGGGHGAKNLNTDASVATAGEANTGSGGGGGGRYKPGMPGGSGIIIIRITSVTKKMVWRAIDIEAGGNTGKIFVDTDAEVKQVGDDYIITYTAEQGGLSFCNPTNKSETLDPVWALARILAVGGGGGGGFIDKQTAGGGGGGGAGGFVESDVDESGKQLVFDNAAVYSISVGRGGAGGERYEAPGKDGGVSSVTKDDRKVIEALGGGGGGAHSAGGNGGSGGGGSRGTNDQGGIKPGGEGLDGQGHSGGAGNGIIIGGGGGGAGGEGGDASTADPTGGVGRVSLITGSEVWYAGGGGGGYVNPNDQVIDKFPGGAGGKGGGGNGAGVDGGSTGKELNPIPAEDGEDGKGGGGGGGTSHVDSTTPAGRGGHGVVIIRLSGFVVKNVPYPKPVPEQPFTYDGNAHTGVVEFYAYDLRGTPVATNADVYTVQAYLKPDSPYTWEPGHSDGDPITWRINQLAVEDPGSEATFTYNGGPQTPVDKVKYRVDENGWASVSNETSGLILRYCRLFEYEKTDAGNYTVKAVLNTEGGLTNFIWFVDGTLTMADQTHDWEITQAPNAIRDFYYPGYPLANLKNHNPKDKFEADWGKETTVVDYRVEGGGDDDWIAWGAAGPTVKGTYEVRVTIPEHDNWQGDSKILPFGTWEKWSDIFSDRAEVTVSGYASKGTSTLTDFPAAVRIKAPDREGWSPMTGFEYGRAGATGQEIRFFDSNGDPVEHEVDVWDTGGESLVWVRVPTLKTANSTAQKGATLTMCWRHVGSIRLPDYDPVRVWNKTYAGVWHMSGLVDGGIADSSGHGMEAALKDGAKATFIDGRAGKALKLEGQDGCLLAPNPQTNTAENVALSYTAWYRDPEFTADGKVTGGNKMFAGSKYGATTTAEMKSWSGWAMRMNNANNRVMWEATGAEGEKNGIGWNLSTTWGFLGIITGYGSNATGVKRTYAYSNTFTEEAVNASYYATGSERPLILTAGGFEVDEARLALKAQPEAWTELEYRSLYNAAFSTFGLVIREEQVCDYWTKTPAQNWKTIWKYGIDTPTPPATGDRGAYQDGGTRVMVSYIALSNHTETTTMPTELGSYRAIFDHSDAVSPTTGPQKGLPYRPLKYAVDFYIVEPATPIYDIGGHLGDSGRILLMNADNNALAPVTNQGWCATDEHGVTWWDRTLDVDGTNNVMPGAQFELNVIRGDETNMLWKLENCRMGNLFPTNEAEELSADLCYLPRSSGTALSITNENVKADRRGDAGWLMMRNKTGSCVTSGCFTNGIGTIYFDAVNSRAGGIADGYRLVLEVANVPEDPDIPLVWRKVAMSPTLFGGSTPVDQKATNELALAVTAGGSEDRFYRVHARVNEHGPMSCRIRRVSADTAAAGVDDGFILLDNIIVSIPPVTAKLEPFGRFEALAEHEESVGYGGALSVPFPSGDGTSLTGRCAVVLPPKSGYEDTKPDEYLSLAQMLYRWRHLDQFRDPDPKTGEEWKAAVLKGVGTDRMVTDGELDVPEGTGDIEFYFLAIMKAPYYEYVDYSGARGVSKAGYTEESPMATNRLDAAELPTLASGGRDWYVQVRPGRSPYEGVQLVTQAADGKGAVETNRFDLIGDGLWCGRLRTPAAVAGGLRYRIEGLNPQTAMSEEYVLSKDCWRSTAPIGEFPATLSLATCTDGQWGNLPCDGRTAWLVFQFDERGSLVISHAEFMDFDMWSSAVNSNGLFTGSSTSTNYFSTATGVTNIDWSAWTVSVATNKDWTEDFGVEPGQRADAAYPKNRPFSSAQTRHGWLAENAQWTYGKWTHETWNAAGTEITTFGDDSAVQLEGCGKGKFSFVSSASTPKGLDTVRSVMRLAQVNRFFDFNLYDKLEIDWEHRTMVFPKELENYTFVTFANLSQWGGDDYSGDGTISLVAYYDEEIGCYEARFSRGSKDTNVRIRLLRWRNDGTQIRSEDLGFKEADGLIPYLMTDNGDFSEAGGLFLSVEECPAGTGGAARPFTLVQAGIRRDARTSTLTTVSALSGKPYMTVAYRDAEDGKRLTHGTYGVLTANCRGSIIKPAYFDEPVGWSLSGSPSANTLKLNQSATITFPGTLKGGPDADYPIGRDYYDNCWIERPGRLAEIDRASSGYYGFEASTRTEGKVEILIAEHGGSQWTPVGTNTVTSFADVAFDTVVHSPLDCDVKFAVMGETEDVRTDVVVNSAELSQWRGQETPLLDSDFGLYRQFIYTGAWLDRRTLLGEGLVLSLQPARAKDASSPVSLRAPLLSGVSIFHFAWRKADPHCVLKLQMLSGEFDTLRSQLIQRTREAPDSERWQTVATYDFSRLPEFGERTFYVNLRGPTAGVMRLVVDRATVENALKKENSEENPFWGGVQITDAYVWDMPAYDNRSWSAWNMRTSGWLNGEPDEWANRGDGRHGYSALLNNTLDESTLADKDKQYYRERPPYVQSPVFGTNCIGEVLFKARLYDKDADLGAESPAVVTFYGAKSYDPDTLEPRNWEEAKGAAVVISNRTYATYRVKLRTSDSYCALRLAVRGVKGVVNDGTGEDNPPLYDPPARVAFDSVYLMEQTPPVIRFRNLHVRPFRDSNLMKTTAIVPEGKITSPDEQPLLGEAFGFQAEIEVQNTEEGEIAVDDPTRPITVDLYYYHGSEPWGYENWKSNATGHARLVAADGTNLIFRSTIAAGTVAPIFRGKDAYGDPNTHEMLQYHMIAHYYEKGGDQPQPLELSARDWTMPSWYEGFVDPNDAEGAKFAAFTILDELSPGRAWINEINYVEGSEEKSKRNQWIELAVPLGVDMTGWEVYLYSYDSATKEGAEHRYDGGGPLFRIGKGECKKAKKDTSDAPETHYAFLTVGSPLTVGVALDNYWYPLYGDAIDGGKLEYVKPYGFELRRPSGVIEHRVVSEGYAEEYEEYWYGFQYTGTNLVKTLSANGEKWLFAGKDPLRDGDGLSVTNGQGKVETDWTVARLTPGGLNAGQIIDPNWYLTPNGDYVWIYPICRSPQIRQIIGSSTNQSDVITVAQGGATNIVYEVDNFYELSDLEIRSEHVLHTLTGPVRRNGKNYYDLRLYDVSNRVDVTAAADVAADLKRRGVTDDNPYKPAIMRWLSDGFTRDEFGNKVKFAGDTVQDFIYRTCNGYDHPTEEVTNLSLKVAYWLDVDVTQAGWELRGAMGDTGGGVLGPVWGELKRQREGETLIHTNRFGTMWLELTNTVTGAAHSPWRLQGLNNERSDDPSTYAGAVWTSVTFKVTGKLQNGKVNKIARPLRYFTFDRNSFRHADDDKAPFSAWVEIVDPFSKQSPASDWGWAPYWDKPVFIGWGISEELTPGGVSVMKFEDSLEDVYGPEVR